MEESPFGSFCRVYLVHTKQEGPRPCTNYSSFHAWWNMSCSVMLTCWNNTSVSLLAQCSPLWTDAQAFKQHDFIMWRDSAWFCLHWFPARLNLGQKLNSLSFKWVLGTKSYLMFTLRKSIWLPYDLLAPVMCCDLWVVAFRKRADTSIVRILLFLVKCDTLT